MGARKFASLDSQLSIIVSDDVIEAMALICRRSSKKESGGVLIGKYSNNGADAEVLEALPAPSDSFGTRSTFHRGTSGLAKELTSRWAKTGTHYIGEWHYHPAGDGQPSDQDAKQMVAFAKIEEMQTAVPIMTIMFPSGKDQYDMRVFVFTPHGANFQFTEVSEPTGKSQ